MLIFGWISLVLLGLFGLFMIGLYIGPFVISKIKSFRYKIKCYVEDEKLDADKRSEERKHRDELKRQKDFELANKKLDAKINKVDKQIKLHTKKLELAEKLKKETEDLKDDYNYQYELDNQDVSQEISDNIPEDVISNIEE